MSWRNAPENFFSAVRGCPRLCARTNPWFRGQILGEKCAQEPTPGSAVKHCWFLDTGGGGYNPGEQRSRAPNSAIGVVHVGIGAVGYPHPPNERLVQRTLGVRTVLIWYPN